MAKLEEGGAHGVVITGDQKPNERSSLGVRVERITANVTAWYIDYQFNSLNC